jgi:hypothetical protein
MTDSKVHKKQLHLPEAMLSARYIRIFSKAICWYNVYVGKDVFVLFWTEEVK